MSAVHLRRIDKARTSPLLSARHRAGFVRRRASDENMGTHRRARARHGRALRQESLAADALQRHAELKRRRGYGN